MKKIVFVLFFLMLTTFGFTQKSVTQLPVDSTFIPSPHSFHYFLPRTAFQVSVTIEKTDFIKGYYTEFAEKMLGITNPITENKRSFQIKNIEINSFTIPDSSKQYVVELSKQQIKSQFYTQLLNQNVLQKYTITPYNLIKTEEISTFFMYYSNQKQLEKEESFVETRIVDGVITQVPVNKTKKITKSLEQQAQEAADFITKIRKDRYNIITAIHEVPFSKEAIQLMIEQLNQLEKNYIELFVGTTTQQVLTVQMVFIPQNEHDLTIPMFSFSETQGLKNFDANIKGEQYVLQIEPRVSLDLYEQQLTFWNTSKKFKKNGYQYRDPIPASLTMYKNNVKFHDFGVFPIFQLGTVKRLPVNSDPFMITNYAIIY